MIINNLVVKIKMNTEEIGQVLFNNRDAAKTTEKVNKVLLCSIIKKVF